MPTDIFEGAPIALKGEITAGHEAATSVTFVLKRDGAALRTVSATIDGRKAEATTPAPTVPDDVENVAVTYTMVVESKEYAGSDGFTVWPRDLVVRVTRERDGAPFDGFRIGVTHDGPKRVLRTLPDGSLRVVRTKPAAVTVAAEAPYELVAWQDDLGRVRACTGRRALKAAIVTPEKPSSGDTIDQLVNLASAAAGVDGLGDVVTVTVCADGDQDRDPGSRTGREGDVIFIEASFGRESKRNAPLPDLRGVEAHTASADGKTVTGQVRLGPNGEPARFDLALGIAGGDTCTLKVGGTAAAGDDTRRFKVWRKLWYQLSRPDTLHLPDLAPVAAGLEKVFVKWEKFHEEVFTEATPPTPPPGIWFDGDHVGLSGRALCISPSLGDDFYQFLYRDERRPVGMHTLLAHLLVQAGEPGSQRDHVTSPALGAAATITFPPAGAAVPGWTFDVDGTKELKRGVYRVSFQDGGIPVRNARWRCVATSGANVGKAGMIPESRIDVPKPTGLSYKDRNTLVHFALPPDAVACLNAGDEVVVEADVVWASGPMRGFAFGGEFITVRNAPSAEMGGTLLHEIGHAMGQVLKTVPPGLDAADHGRQYTERGHTGHHCAFGVDAAAFDKDGKTASLLGRTDANCVMFGEHTDGRPVHFCEKCEPFTRAGDLHSLVTS